MTLVSIIIPCYNYGKLLAETLDSVAAQTYVHWECIIIDDGSVDNSRQVGEAYQQQDARFRYIYQENKGMSAARNRGLAVARGEYIQLLDADDSLVNGKLEYQAAYLDTHPEVALVYGNVRYFQHDMPMLLSQSFDMRDEPWMPETQGKGEELWGVLVEKNIMAVNAALFRLSLVKEAGGFNEKLRAVEDWEFWVRCALTGARFAYDPNPATWALVRIHNSNTTHNMARMQRFEVQVRLQLQEVLQKMGAHQAILINEQAILNSEVHLASHNLTKANMWQGIKGFLQLARSTGRYGYYLKSIPYYLKMRLSYSRNNLRGKSENFTA
jgi:glycosyltransferase involved in cell wall biosynthesis